MIRKNVAGQFLYFSMINASTGAAMTGLSGSITKRRNIDGTNAAATGTITEPNNDGQYQMALSQADTDGNDIGYYFTATGAIPVSFTVLTTAANPADAARLGLTSLPNAVPGAAGGTLIAGSNSGTITFGAFTVTGTMTVSDGIIVTRSTGNSAGVSLSGSGSGHGLNVVAGATGNGVSIVGGATLGNGVRIATTLGDALLLAPTSGTGISGNMTGNVSGSVTSVTNPVTVGTNNDKTGYSISGTITTLDGLNTTLPTTILSTALPGAFTTGQFGFIVGTNLDAKSSDILEQVTNVAIGSSAINVRASTFVLTTGSVASGTVTDTQTVNQVYHQLQDTGGNFEAYYEYGLGRNGVPASFTWRGRLNGNNDNMSVWAFNWATTTWEQIGLVVGIVGSTDATFSYPLFQTQVGTGANLGKVRVRFLNSGALTSANLFVDQSYVTYAVVDRPLGFEGDVISATSTTVELDTVASAQDDFYVPGLITIKSGAGSDQFRRISAYNGTTKVVTVATPWVTNPDSTSVVKIQPWGSVRVSEFDLGLLDEYAGFVWIDNVIGTAGSTSDVHGTRKNPTTNFADALTIATAKKIPRYHVRTGSALTLSANLGAFQSMIATGANIIIDTASVSTGRIIGAGNVQGTVNLNASFRFEDLQCSSITLTNNGASFFNSRVGVIVCNAACNVTMMNCRPQTTSMTLNCGSFDINAWIRGWAGNLSILNPAAGSVIYVEGTGSISFTGGTSTTVYLRGNIEVTGTVPAGITIVEDARVTQDSIARKILPEKNKALNNLEFLMVAASDHATPVTGASGLAVTRSIDGAGFVAANGTVAEVGNGIYQYDASAEDMNGGIITFRFTATGGTPGLPDDRFVTVVTDQGV